MFSESILALGGLSVEENPLATLLKKGGGDSFFAIQP
jgi:hypothetical protein